jgi:hypothetical protein
LFRLKLGGFLTCVNQHCKLAYKPIAQKPSHTPSPTSKSNGKITVLAWVQAFFPVPTLKTRLPIAAQTSCTRSRVSSISWAACSEVIGQAAKWGEL